MKWLDPKIYPIPEDEYFLGYIENAVHAIKWNSCIEKFVTFNHLYNDYGSDCAGMYRKFMKKDIIAWIHIPQPPTEIQNYESLLEKAKSKYRETNGLDQNHFIAGFMAAHDLPYYFIDSLS